MNLINITQRVRSPLTCMVVLLMLSIAVPVHSQSILEEVTVTARKRSENLQEIPDAVTVFNTELIQDARIENIKDFAELTPNLNVSSNWRAGLNFISIRGLITPQVGEAPISFVVDGVTVPNLEFVNQGLYDIERIEVLRGPQGALYGKNAIGGAINIITRQPSDELSGVMQASYGEGDDVRVSGALSGPLVQDRVYYRISANYRDYNGQIENSFTGRKVDYVDDQYGLQGLLRFNISAQTTLDLQGRYSNTTQGTNYMSFIQLDQLEDFSIAPDQNATGIDEAVLWNVSAKFDHETDQGNFTLVAGFNKSADDQFSDADFGHLGEADANFYFPSTQINAVNEESITVEGRFSSAEDSRLRWLIGGFYETRKRKVQFDQIYDYPGTTIVTRKDVIPLLVRSNFYNPEDLWVTVFPTDGERTNQDTDAFAFFGQVNYDLADTVEVTLALRYDEEKREAFDERTRFTADSEIEDTFNELQPKASITWQVMDDILLSATYSRGFRSGGFNEYAPTVQRNYSKETSDTFEIGAKTMWFDGRLRFNFSAFYIEQENAQFTRFNSTTFTLENLNVDEVEIKGVEVELGARPAHNLDIAFGFGYIDNEITKNEGIDVFTGLDLATTIGNTMPYVSDFNLNGSISYIFQLGTLELKPRVSFNTLGPRSFDIFNSLTGESDTHTFVNASIGLATGKWSVSVYADNLFDEDAQETVFFYNPLIRFPNQPRHVGVQARMQF